jgi:hypothetical protein
VPDEKRLVLMKLAHQIPLTRDVSNDFAAKAPAVVKEHHIIMMQVLFSVFHWQHLLACQLLFLVLGPMLSELQEAISSSIRDA